MFVGPPLGRAPGMDHRVALVIDLLKERLHAPIDFETIAAEVGLSPSRFAFLFREAVGLPPAAYLHGMRLERARLLIESTDLRVSEVMRQVGLSDPSHFSRDFRNAHGLSPRGYRLQLRLTGPQWRFVARAAQRPPVGKDRPTEEER